MNSNVTLYPPQIVMTISTDYFPKINRNSGILQVAFLKHADFCTLIEKLFLFICPSFRSGYYQSRQEWNYTQQLHIWSSPSAWFGSENREFGTSFETGTCNKRKIVTGIRSECFVEIRKNHRKWKHHHTFGRGRTKILKGNWRTQKKRMNKANC